MPASKEPFIRDTTPKPSQFKVDSVAIGYVSKKEVRYVVFGNDLDKGTLLTPRPKTLTLLKDSKNKVLEFSLPISEDEAYKKLVFQSNDDQLIYTFDLPAPDAKKEEPAKPDDPKAFKMTLTGTLPK